jgi:two-component system sensor kinase FixL
MAAAAPPVDFRAVFEKSPVNYLILTPGFEIVAATDGYCRVSRAERSDLVGRNLFDLLTKDASRPDADSVTQLRASLERVSRSRRSDAMPVLRYDLPCPARPGELDEKYWSTSNTPILDRDGSLLWIVYRVRDVTRSVLNPDTEESQSRLGREQDHMLARLRAANDELAQLESLRSGMAQMSRLSTVAMMASALAHDVSQPLTAARNYLSALRRGRTIFGELQYEELMTKLAFQIDRAGEIVKGLRTFMAASTTVHKSEDVASVIADAVRLEDTLIRKNGIALTVHVQPGLPRVAMDRVQIQQCLLNLLTNAVDATRDAPRRAIDISAGMQEGALRIAVADTGSGVPPDIAARLDEPFATTSSIHGGLGLPICRQIVKEHHGVMAVTANHPTGTVIAFTIAPPSGR